MQLSCPVFVHVQACLPYVGSVDWTKYQQAADYVMVESQHWAITDLEQPCGNTLAAGSRCFPTIWSATGGGNGGQGHSWKYEATINFGITEGFVIYGNAVMIKNPAKKDLLGFVDLDTNNRSEQGQWQLNLITLDPVSLSAIGSADAIPFHEHLSPLPLDSAKCVFQFAKQYRPPEILFNR